MGHSSHGRKTDSLFRIRLNMASVLLLVERIEQVKGVLHVKQERKELLSLSGTSVGIKQAKLTKLASVRILTLVILEYMF